MTVEQIITALIGLPRRAHVEVVDDDGGAAQITSITSSVYNGTTYVNVTIDRYVRTDDDIAERESEATA